MPNLTGQSIGRYHILEQLGEGGMATVYKAYDTRLERNVAFKVLRTDLFGSAIIEQILKRFEREAKSLAKLKHPNIVNILDFGEHEGMPYLVMEYLPGGTLKQKLGQVIPWQEAIQILLPVARGLSYAHQHGVIHRDVKPANILIDQNEEPILTDFGIAKLLEGTEGHTITGSGVGIGTPEYMAPEQGVGARDIDARADIYSLGIVFYEMVTGRKPYIADTPMAVVLKQMTDPLPRPTDFVPDLPEGVEHVLFKALAKQPEDRYADMSALIAAMELALTEAQKVEAPLPAKQVKKKAISRFKPSPKLIAAGIGVLTVALVIIFGAPRVKQQLSAAPEARATSTVKSVILPTSTFTLIPSAPPHKLTLTPKLTETPMPKLTSTPVPAWVTNFAAPILAAIKDRPPDFQDDFSPNDPRGLPRGWSGTDNIPIENGMMRLDNQYITNTYFSFKTNYVLQVDVSPPISCCVNVRLSMTNSGWGEGYWISLDQGKWGICDPNNECIWENYNFNQTIQLTVISRKSQAGIYFQGYPVYYFSDPSLAIGFYTRPMIDCWGTSCELDNVKFWNLDNIPLSASLTQGSTSYPKLTETLQTTPTNNRDSTWVTNFTEPILAAIKDHQPSFQDDFSYSYGQGWYSGEPEKSWTIENGVLINEKNSCSLIQNKALVHPNFVLQVDIPGDYGSIIFYGTWNGFDRYRAEVKRQGNNLEWKFGVMNDGYIKQPFGNLPTTNLTNNVAQVIIVNRNLQAAFYLNEIPLAYIAKLTLDYPVNGVSFECGKFDNVKFWNLDKIPNLP